MLDFFIRRCRRGPIRGWLAALAAGVVILGSVIGPVADAAQPYPARPITMIVPFPAGGATDTLARYLAEQMRPALGQSIIIENVAGAAGTIGVGRAVRSSADGYTLSIGTSTTHMLTGGLYELPFDLLKDLEPVIYIGSEPLLIAGRKNLPADDLKGLIAYLKENPDRVSVGIAGVGAAGHLAGIAFRKETGTKFQFVPYRGNAPAMQDLLAGQIDFMMEPSSNFRSLIATDSIKPLAVTGQARLSASPTIPTVDEAGLPGFFASLWYGLWAPKDTPKEIVEKLNAVLRNVLADPVVQKRFDDLGIQISPREQQSPEALREFQKAESERWWPVIKASNLRGE
ncbi:MAG TPA: tripartite tricarboxylate transporter substrate-binding protein [Bradyrhizobium sp.]|nr:tripartite tricarboxylate transporter substrate-binding protein [Bradyrhizobium sp.]